VSAFLAVTGLAEDLVEGAEAGARRQEAPYGVADVLARFFPGCATAGYVERRSVSDVGVAFLEDMGVEGDVLEGVVSSSSVFMALQTMPFSV
jgi:hypothetical protein